MIAFEACVAFGGGAVYPADRLDHGPMPSVYLLQRVGNLADRRAFLRSGHDGQFQEVTGDLCLGRLA